MALPRGIYRADHVGSLLRPKTLLEARAKLANPTDTTSLRALEDELIAEVIAKQLKNGLRSITDGEFRRTYFHIDFLKNLAGVSVEGSLTSTNHTKTGLSPPRLVVTDKIAHTHPIQVDDFLHLQRSLATASTDHNLGPPSLATPEVCIPSPTMVHFRSDRTTVSRTAYPTLLPDLFTDLASAYRAELHALYEAGCRHVQLDDTNLAYLCDPAMAAAAATRHPDTDPHTLTQQYTSLINASITPRPADLIVSIHLCRGNFRSQWFAQGGYAPVAASLFPHLAVDAFFLEYDDPRSGDFAPLRYLPADKLVVLGLMSSKSAALGDRTPVIRRLHEAAAFCPRGLDQVCLSHQCGFSSTVEGNELTEDEQWAKVRLMVDIAREVWWEGEREKEEKGEEDDDDDVVG